MAKFEYNTLHTFLGYEGIVLGAIVFLAAFLTLIRLARQ